MRTIQWISSFWIIIRILNLLILMNFEQVWIVNLQAPNKPIENKLKVIKNREKQINNRGIMKNR